MLKPLSKSMLISPSTFHQTFKVIDYPDGFNLDKAVQGWFY
jgi:hypothetical protein